MLKILHLYIKDVTVVTNSYDKKVIHVNSLDQSGSTDLF